MGELIFCSLLTVFFSIMAVGGWLTTNVYLGDMAVKFYPCAILVLVVFLLLIHCVGLYRRLPVTEKQKSVWDVFRLREKRTWLFILTLILTIAYFIFLDRLGYLLLTPLIATWYIMVLGERNWWKAALVALGVTVIVFCLFVYALDIRLPRGTGIFRRFSMLVEYIFD
jgi:hypothetical protein